MILGGGLTGLAAATRLGRAAVVLEADARPGGLVRTERFGEYWFDRVSHLLFFPNEEVEADVRGRVGDVLAPCPPSAWVTTHSGVARFPLQHHCLPVQRQMIAILGHHRLDHHPIAGQAAFHDALRKFRHVHALAWCHLLRPAAAGERRL